MSVSPACVSEYHLHAWYPWRPEEGIRCPGNGVIDDYKIPCGY